ncbi:MAG: hypothetical protein ACQETZ_06745 [Candidatus Fermentibacterota bacterium]
MTPLLMAAAFLFGGMPPAAAAEEALRMLSEGRPEEAAAVLDSLSVRMPHNHRLALDLAAALFADSAFSMADSTVRGLAPGEGVLDVPSDTLSSAAAAASLAASMAAGDHGGVSAAADTLRSLLTRRGDPAGVDAANLEAALLWLRSHQPPPPQEGGGGDSREDRQQEDEGRESEGGGEDRQSPQQQEEDADDRREGERGESEVPRVPEEMTPEMARRILDMVDEASPGDTLKAGAAGGRLSW